jgi:hypothetical protein
MPAGYNENVEQFHKVEKATVLSGSLLFMALIRDRHDLRASSVPFVVFQLP